LKSLTNPRSIPLSAKVFNTVASGINTAPIPCIASNIYGLNDAIVNNKTGLLHKVKDIDDIIIKYDDRDLESILKVNSDRPIIYKEMNLQDETLCILDKLFNFDDNTFNPLWENKLFMCRKYTHFLNLNNNKLSNIEEKLRNSFTASSELETVLANNNSLEFLFD
jgi:hypothetical protein